MLSVSRGRKRARTSRARNGLAIRAALVIAPLLVMVVAVLWFSRTPGGEHTNGPKVRVLIPAGSTFRAAADSLADAKLIRWPRLFSIYGSFKGRDRTIRAGTYELPRGQSWDALIDALHTGRGVVATITIPEGWTLRRIIPYLAEELELPAESLRVATQDSALRARLGVPTKDLEGYLFPDTYTIALGTTARQLVALMVARFEQIWRPEWTARLDTLRRTRHEIVTMASIIETEVQRAEERPVVSAVYWNRIRARMRLQADPTVLYALGRHQSRVLFRDLEVKSPYNTYRNDGLPPGPIAAPGAASLEAAVYPAQVPYLFFVAAPDGHHEFRRTMREHQLAIQKVRAQARAKAAADSAAARDSSGRGGRGDTTAQGGANAARGRGGK
jgi:UPF0755 protein